MNILPDIVYRCRIIMECYLRVIYKGNNVIYWKCSFIQITFEKHENSPIEAQSLKSALNHSILSILFDRSKYMVNILYQIRFHSTFSSIHRKIVPFCHVCFFCISNIQFCFIYSRKVVQRCVHI